MIIVKSPFRISFSGGGTDIPYFYEKYGGCVISTSIDKYIYLSMHPLFQNNSSLIKYSKTERVSDISQIEHNFIREIFRKYNIHGVDFNSSADIPSGTGLSSSSAFTAALIMLCNVYKEQYITKDEIADMAFELEKLYSPSIGKQDQYATAFGGLNYIQFEPNGLVNVERLYVPKDGMKRLQNNLKLFYTGITHDSVIMLNIQKKENNDDKNKTLLKMKDLTLELKEQLLKNNIDAMGDILAQGWDLKRSLNSQMSCGEIDHIYNKAIEAGATGGKLLGAGGGGFMLFYVKEQYHNTIKKALDDYQELEFTFDTTGTSVIYN